MYAPRAEITKKAEPTMFITQPRAPAVVLPVLNGVAKCEEHRTRDQEAQGTEEVGDPNNSRWAMESDRIKAPVMEV